MIILAIETSCDDTCISILEAQRKKRPKFKVLSNVISSQIEIHKKWGGVWPSLAKREHQKNLVPILKQALMESRLLNSRSGSERGSPKAAKLKIPAQEVSEARQRRRNLEKILEREPDLLKNLAKFLKRYKKPKVDVIAVTVGPGLEPCLWTGVNFARALGFFWNLKILPINHIEAHIFANWLKPIRSNFQFPRGPLQREGGGWVASNFQFPAVCLIVSGGHTQLILMKDFAPVVERSSLRGYPEVNSVLLRGGKYKILGETRDDAAGECFDKVARILGLGYPGGPAIAAQAAKVRSTKYEETKKSSDLQTSDFRLRLPRPMIYQKNYDFSFSGLKTAVLYDFKSRSPKIRKSKEYIKKIAAETQQAIIDVLIHKILKATKNYKAKAIILGGGVAANDELRKQFKEACSNSGLKQLVPPKELCTDNAAMVAVAGYFHWLKNEIRNWREIKASANLRIDGTS